MSTYTIQVRYMVENNFDFGLKDYPIFDENYRELLNKKIIDHFYFREIGFETTELFKFYLNRTMREIMPYYNQLYKSELLEFNPFYNVDKYIDYNRLSNGNKQNVANNQTTNDLKTESTNNIESNDNVFSTGTNDSHSANNTDTKNKNVHSDTPQGLLNIGTIENEIYASDADISHNGESSTGSSHNNNTQLSENKGNTEQKGETTNTGTVSNALTATENNQNTENYLSHVLGKSEGETYSEMLIKFRDTFLNIDMLVINELNSLFMGVY